MEKDNFERMIQLAEEFFDAKNDPDQLSINEEVIEQLRELHPSAVTEETDNNGPIAWMIIIPTTRKLMDQFIGGTINERELFAMTPRGASYEAVYLCSALVLPEHRRKGLAKRMVVNALAEIRQKHPVGTLFTWSFSAEGESLAEAVAKEAGLPLRKRER